MHLYCRVVMKVLPEKPTNLRQVCSHHDVVAIPQIRRYARRDQPCARAQLYYDQSLRVGRVPRVLDGRYKRRWIKFKSNIFMIYR